MRIIITLTVSKTGIHNTANVNGTMPKLGSILVPWGYVERMLMTKIEKIMPNDSVPASPINIFEFVPNTLWKKNGMSDEATIMASVAMRILSIE